MQGKKILITGATSGIGKATAKSLAGMGAELILVGRDQEKLQKLQHKMKTKSKNSNIDIFVADLASQKSIANLAIQIKEHYEKLDVLLNNAGAIFQHKEITPDGFEQTFALNHLAYFKLTISLLGLLKKAPSARIISVSSDAHKSAKIDLDDAMFEKNKYSAIKAYCNSKLANVLFTYELARRLEGTNITANALHPGVVSSNFGKNASGAMRLMVGVMQPFMISPKKGAETPIFLASSPEVDGVTGCYFKKKEPCPTSPASYDQVMARELWALSEKLTDVYFESFTPVRKPAQ